VIAPDAQDLIIHHDLAPWTWDLAYAAHGFIPLAPQTPISRGGRRLAALADGYRLDQDGRSALADLLVPRITSMYDLLHAGHLSQAQSWARLWAEGHGQIWLANAEYAQRHSAALRKALMHS